MKNLLLAATLVAYLGTSSAKADDDHITVLSYVPAVHSLVLNLEPGTGIAPKLLLEDGDTLHDIKATPGKLELLLSSDIVLLIGNDDPNLATLDRLAELRGSMHGLVDLSSHFSHEELIRYEDCSAHHHHHHDAHGHGDDDHEEDGGHDDHGHDEHEETHDDHDDHGHGNDDHEEDGVHDDHGHHDDGNGSSVAGEVCFDSHIWLSTTTSRKMIDIIAGELREFLHEKERLEKLSDNVALAESMLEDTASRIHTILEQHRQKRDTAIVVMHDAFQYFVRDHSLPEYKDAGQADVHSPTPSGKRLAEITAHLKEAEKGCVVVNSDQERKAHAGLFEDLGNFRLVVADPVYLRGEVTKDSYNRLMIDIASAFAECYE